MNLISYQTANFGPNGQTRPIGADAQGGNDASSPNDPGSSTVIKNQDSSPTDNINNNKGNSGMKNQQ